MRAGCILWACQLLHVWGASEAHVCVSELCKYGIIQKWHRNLPGNLPGNLRRHLDAVIPLYTVFYYDLRNNLLFLP